MCVYIFSTVISIGTANTHDAIQQRQKLGVCVCVCVLSLLQAIQADLDILFVHSKALYVHKSTARGGPTDHQMSACFLCSRIRRRRHAPLCRQPIDVCEVYTNVPNEHK